MNLSPRTRSYHLGLILAGLTFVTGLLDAVTYLSFGHVFAANQTGNIIVLGFALAGEQQISTTASIASLASFILGAAFSGGAARALHQKSNRWMLLMSASEVCVLGVASPASTWPVLATRSEAMVSLIALAMGMRTVTVQRLGANGISTTVLSTTLGTLAAESLSIRAGWDIASPRAAAVVTMLLGAASGALLLQYGPTLVLTLATVISLLAAVLVYGVPVPGTTSTRSR